MDQDPHLRPKTLKMLGEKPREVLQDDFLAKTP